MATREQLIEDFADHKYATGEKFARLINSMKVVQEPVESPAESGTSNSFIDSISQGADGKITATKKSVVLNYAQIQDKPTINGVTLMGDKTPAQLGLATANQVEVVSNKVDKLPSGYYYGKFNSVEDLPEATEKGYAYIASSDPTVFYTYLVSGAGAEWVDSGNKMVNTIDITTPKTEDTKLSQGEKYYASANVNDRPAQVVIETGVVRSLGYRVLSPNLSFAEQVTEANTIYEVKDEFGLNNGNVSIPSGCTLKFNGGRLVNGHLNLDNTEIEADAVKIFDNITINGAKVLNFAWWGGVNGSEVDSSKAWNEMVTTINSQNNSIVEIPKGVYNIGNAVNWTITSSCTIIGNNSTLIVGNGGIIFAGVKTDLNIVTESLNIHTFVKGSTVIEIKFEEELNEGDWLAIVDNRNYSYSPSRYYYKRSEYVQVKNVNIENGTVGLYTALIQDYDLDSVIAISKLSTISVDVSDLTVNRTETNSVDAYSCITLRLCDKSKLSNVSAVGSNQALISLISSFNTVVENCNLNYKSNKIVGLNYGIQILSCLYVWVNNCNLKASRHALTHGTGYTQVTCRHIYHNNCVYETYGGSYSCDVHDGCEYITFGQCVINGGLDYGGLHGTFVNCSINNSTIDDTLMYYTLTTNDIQFINCNFSSVSYGRLFRITDPLMIYEKVGELSFQGCTFQRGDYVSGPSAHSIEAISSSAIAACWVHEVTNNEEVIEEYVYTLTDNNVDKDAPVVRMPLYDIEGHIIGHVESVNITDYNSIKFENKTYNRLYNNGSKVNKTLYSPHKGNVDFLNCRFIGKIANAPYREDLFLDTNSEFNFSSCSFKRWSFNIKVCNNLSLINCDFDYKEGPSYVIYGEATTTINGLLIFEGCTFKDCSRIFSMTQRTTSTKIVKNNTLYATHTKPSQLYVGDECGIIIYTGNTIVTDDDIVAVLTPKGENLVWSNNVVSGSGKVSFNSKLSKGSQIYNDVFGIPLWWDGEAYVKANGDYLTIDQRKFTIEVSGGTKTANTNNMQISSVQALIEAPLVTYQLHKRISGGNGSVLNISGNYYASNFIIVEGFEKITFVQRQRASGNPQGGYAFYTADGSTVSSEWYPELEPGSSDVDVPITIDVPNGAVYFRYTLMPGMIGTSKAIVKLINPTSDSWVYFYNTLSSLTAVFKLNKNGNQRIAKGVITGNDGYVYTVIYAQTGSTAISVDTNALTFGTTDQTAQIVTVTTDSNIISYVNISDSWITATISNKTVSINVTDNTGEERTGKVTIVDMDSKVIEVSVTQNGIN